MRSTKSFSLFIYYLSTSYFFNQSITYFWKSFKQISWINGYSNVRRGSKNIKCCRFCVKILYRQCREIVKKLYFKRSIICQLFQTNIFYQKYLTLQNHFQVDNSYAFLKAIFHECQRSCKFESLYSSFVYNMSGDAAYCIVCAIFLSAEKQRTIGSFVSKV